MLGKKSLHCLPSFLSSYYAIFEERIAWSPGGAKQKQEREWLQREEEKASNKQYRGHTYEGYGCKNSTVTPITLPACSIIVFSQLRLFFV